MDRFDWDLGESKKAFSLCLNRIIVNRELVCVNREEAIAETEGEKTKSSEEMTSFYLTPTSNDWDREDSSSSVRHFQALQTLATDLPIDTCLNGSQIIARYHAICERFH